MAADARAGLVLAIDQGTTNTKALLVDGASGAVVATGSRGLAVRFPAPGWVEQDAAEIWAATRAAVTQCLASAGSGGLAGEGLAGIAVSNQRESVVAWSRTTGAPLGAVLGWQDARTGAACAALAAAGLGEEIRRRTGLSLDPMYSAPKMRWLLDHALAAGAAADDICLGTVDAWLVWNLTGGAVHATEAGNASRTLLLDLATLDWAPSLLDAFGIPGGALPEVRASDAGFGTTAAGGPVPAGVPVVAVLADSHAALYQHGCTTPGTGKATYGTGSSVMTPCAGPDAPPDGITTTLAWLTAAGPTYAREGNIVASGSALDWLAAMVGADADVGGRSGGALLTELAGDLPDAAGVHFVPAFSGLGAPYWDRSATGVVTGVTGGTTRAHLARAALEAVAHQVADVVEAVESDGGARIDVLHADGGATASASLMQAQADLLGRPVVVADVSEASALGAALLAARTLGLAPEPAGVADRTGGPAADPAGVAAEPGTGDGAPVPPARARDGVIAPRLPDADRAARRSAWATAVRRSRGLPAQPGAGDPGPP